MEGVGEALSQGAISCGFSLQLWVLVIILCIISIASKGFFLLFLQGRFFLNDGCVKIYWFSFKIIIFCEGQRIMQNVFRLRFLLGGPSF